MLWENWSIKKFGRHTVETRYNQNHDVNKINCKVMLFFILSAKEEKYINIYNWIIHKEIFEIKKK